MFTFKIRALILTAPLLCSTLVAAMQDAPQVPAAGDMPTFSYKEMVSIAHNTSLGRSTQVRRSGYTVLDF